MKYHTTHSIICKVDAKTVFFLLENVNMWPKVMEPCKKAVIIKKEERNEIIELTADINGIEMTWQSKREVFPDLLMIKSDIFKPMEPAESMWAVWQVFPINRSKCVLVLNHDYDIKKDVYGLIPGVEDVSGAVKFLNKAINANSNIELSNIKAFVETNITEATERCSNHYSFSKIYSISASEIYQLLRNTDEWISMFNNCEKTQILKQSKESETIQIWGYQDEKLIDWITRRDYIDDSYRIIYTFEKQMPLLNEMHGEWQVIPIDEESCIISVKRYWVLKQGMKDMQKAEQIMYDFVTTNTENEFNAIAAKVKKAEKKNVMVKSIHIAADATSVYEFMRDLNKWKEYVPHCKSLDILYDDGVNQIFTMAANQFEAFRSVRVCENTELKISYFQISPPPLLSHHTGEWLFIQETGGTKVIFRHEYVVNTDNCCKKFHCDNYKVHVKKIEEMLTDNSLSTLEACEKYLVKKGSCYENITGII